MARYTDSQLNRLADRLRDDQDLTAQECINLVGDCQRLAVDLINMTEDRDALRAELATVKAALPRWRKYEDAWCLELGEVCRWVTPCGNKWTALYYTLAAFDTKEAAMTAVTEALGLPPCEVADA
jgi:hypothetical protein